MTQFVELYGYVDGVGPAIIQGDLPSKKSQLDVIPFATGIPIVGGNVVP